jgi:hypothetical protein
MHQGSRSRRAIGPGPELLDQQHRVASGIVGQHRDRIAAREDSALDLRRHRAVEAPVPQFVPFEGEMPDEGAVEAVGTRIADRMVASQPRRLGRPAPHPRKGPRHDRREVDLPGGDASDKARDLPDHLRKQGGFGQAGRRLSGLDGARRPASPAEGSEAVVGPRERPVTELDDPRGGLRARPLVGARGGQRASKKRLGDGGIAPRPCENDPRLHVRPHLRRSAPPAGPRFCAGAVIRGGKRLVTPAHRS